MKMKIKVKNRSEMSFKKIEKKIDKHMLRILRFPDGQAEGIAVIGMIIMCAIFCFIGIGLLFTPNEEFIYKNGEMGSLFAIILTKGFGGLFAFGSVFMIIMMIREKVLIRNLHEIISYCDDLEIKIFAMEDFLEKASFFRCFDSMYNDFDNHETDPLDAYKMLLFAKDGKTHCQTLKHDKKKGITLSQGKQGLSYSIPKTNIYRIPHLKKSYARYEGWRIVLYLTKGDYKKYGK